MERLLRFMGNCIPRMESVREDEDGEMSPEEIMKMNWLADIVVGSIPTLDELVEDARDVVA